MATGAARGRSDVAPVTPADRAPLLRALEADDACLVAARLANNMEDAACSLEPAVANALSPTYGAWRFGARLSISSSVCEACAKVLSLSSDTPTSKTWTTFACVM